MQMSSYHPPLGGKITLPSLLPVEEISLLEYTMFFVVF